VQQITSIDADRLAAKSAANATADAARSEPSVPTTTRFLGPTTVAARPSFTTTTGHGALLATAKDTEPSRVARTEPRPRQTTTSEEASADSSTSACVGLRRSGTGMSRLGRSGPAAASSSSRPSRRTGSAGRPAARCPASRCRRTRKRHLCEPGAAAPGHLYVVSGARPSESGSVAPAPRVGSALLHVRGRPEHLRAPRIGPLLLSQHCLVYASQFRVT
jgi:hypothetical protein